MTKRTFATFSMTCALVAMSTGVTYASGLYTVDHGDVGVNYESGAWDLHWHLGPNAIVDGSPVGNAPEGEEFEPGDITAFVADPSLNRPAGAQWDPIGVGTGEGFWLLPQSEDPAKPFLGIAAEELETGIFANDQVTLALTGLTGPGDFSLWQTDGFGTPTFFMSSSDGGIDAADSVLLNAGAHAHYNWGFTAPGLYEVTFTASGDLVGGGPTSGTGTYSFLVAPEPGSLALLGIGAIGLLRRTRRA